MSDRGARGDGISPERRGRADRQHQREAVVLRAVTMFDGEPPLSCSVIDISPGGLRLKLEFLTPALGAEVALTIEALGVRVIGRVIRTYDTPTGLEVAVQFSSIQNQIPGKLLQYKLKTLTRSGGRR